MPKRATPRDLADRRFVRALDDTDDALVVGEAVALDVVPAGIVLRGAGALLDALCLVALLVVLLIGASRVWPSRIDSAWSAAAQIVVVVVVFVLVPAAVETATRGRSVGRYAVGTRVVRVDGGAVSFRHAFTRALVGLLELWLTVGSLAMVVALFGSRPRRLGDLLAGTVVQHERLRRSVDPVVTLPPSLVGWAGVADVRRLPQRLENRIAAFFRGAVTVQPGLRAEVARALAAEVAEYAAPVPAVPAEEFLAGVVALRRSRDLRAFTGRARTLDRASAAAGARPPGFPR
jgi:uncharacterized RDD family membrane protein YckC